ncbi:hypothetical protein [[Ruminococcus] lactaris]|uniref:hypothetical protein n=1 Tax=[Ruminococcus] lactaris TaxID=46228 RepID=UPI001F2BC5FF|nr:hypothetical protein [[Ruminococcus] lactaris]
MQEEVTQKTVTFYVRTTKMTADILKKILAAYLRHQKQKQMEKKAQKNQPKEKHLSLKKGKSYQSMSVWKSIRRKFKKNREKMSWREELIGV